MHAVAAPLCVARSVHRFPSVPSNVFHPSGSEGFWPATDCVKGGVRLTGRRRSGQHKRQRAVPKLVRLRQRLLCHVDRLLLRDAFRMVRHFGILVIVPTAHRHCFPTPNLAPFRRPTLVIPPVKPYLDVLWVCGEIDLVLLCYLSCTCTHARAGVRTHTPTHTMHTSPPHTYHTYQVTADCLLGTTRLDPWFGMQMLAGLCYWRTFRDSSRGCWLVAILVWRRTWWAGRSTRHCHRRPRGSELGTLALIMHPKYSHTRTRTRTRTRTHERTNICTHTGAHALAQAPAHAHDTHTHTPHTSTYNVQRRALAPTHSYPRLSVYGPVGLRHSRLAAHILPIPFLVVPTVVFGGSYFN
jgi:hypothetical protein